MNVIANIDILHNGRQYRPGDTIKDFNSETLALWVKYKSVRCEDEPKPDEEEEKSDTGASQKPKGGKKKAEDA